MNEFQKLTEQLHKISLDEMAMAWVDKQANKCVWVENPNTYSNEYFKYLDSFSYIKADKVARISLQSPEYIEHADSKKSWKLTSKEKKELVMLMNKESRVYKGYSNWQATLIRYNFDNFFINPLDTIEGTFDKVKYPQAFEIDYPMPNYLEL